MNIPQTILIGLAVVALLISMVGSMLAFAKYTKKEGASLLGFGYANYYWGDLRKEHPGLFSMSLGGILGMIAFFVLAGLFRE